MTRLKPKWYQKLRGALSEVDKKFADREDLQPTKIQELEEQMDGLPFDEGKNFGIENSKSLAKKAKSHKGLR